MIRCKYCDTECKNISGLSRHNKLAHNIDLAQFKIKYSELFPKKEITDDMIQCKICNDYVLPLGMPSHLSRKHNLRSKEYYDKYVKTEIEGICKMCNKPTTFRGIRYGYSKYCSSKCANLDPEVQAKLKLTDEQKLAIAKKREQTCLEKYGVTSTLKLDYVRKKTMESIKSKEVIEKRKKTNQEKYGVDTPSQSKEIQDKIKKTNLEKYGAENIYASDYGKQKIKETNLKRHGCENGGASKQAQQKIKETKNKKTIQFCEENNCIPLTELDVDYSVKDSIFHSKLLLFNDRYYVKNENINEIINHTPKNNNQSVIENSIASFIESIYDGEIIRNTRSIIKPKELDIYIPDKKLAIEVDGIWFHSTNNFTPKDYHLSKTLACDSLGIRLIHINDWEWENRPDICDAALG